mmetsp:Transcript_25374/g.30071  ORF Transcript_25374/g.30071 Transcript_25374/m.30071 type:complete len:111 (-) Transcript_25374:73-405(-)
MELTNSTWFDSACESIIQWGTRSQWHRPTVMEVLAEEVVPHVILVLFVLIFLQIWLILREGESINDKLEVDQKTQISSESSSKKTGTKSKSSNETNLDPKNTKLRQRKKK